MKNKTIIAVLYTLSAAIASAAFRLAMNWTAEAPMSANLLQEVLFTLLFYGVIGLWIGFWGKTRASLVLWSIVAGIALPLIPMFVIQTMQGQYRFPIELLIWTIIKSIIINAFSLIPVFLLWKYDAVGFQNLRPNPPQ